MKRNLALALGLVAVAVLAASGCKIKGSNNSLPVVKSARFEPPAVMPGDTVAVVVEASDKDGDKYEVEYEWLADGQKLSQTGSAVPSTGYGAGVKFTVRFRVKELPSGLLTEWEEKSITLGAPAPVTIKGVILEPVPVPEGQNARAVVDYGEVEPTSVTLYYKWKINGKEMEGDEYRGEELSGKLMKRGDQVMVSVSEDEEFKGQTWTSPAVPIVGNPPVFTTEPSAVTEGQTVSIKFEADDPDGGPVNYSITGAPNGTTRSKTGYQINLGVAAPGEYQMTLTATDGTGASTSFDLTLTIPERRAAVPAPPPVQPPAAQEPTEGETPAQQPPPSGY